MKHISKGEYGIDKVGGSSIEKPWIVYKNNEAGNWIVRRCHTLTEAGGVIDELKEEESE